MARTKRDRTFVSKQKHEQEYAPKRKTPGKVYKHRLFGVWVFALGHRGGWLREADSQAILAFKKKSEANQRAMHPTSEVRPLGTLER